MFACQNSDINESYEIKAIGYGTESDEKNYPYVKSAAIYRNGLKNKAISYFEITNPTGPCIKLLNCSNITIRYCKLGPSKNEGVILYNCKNITIIYNTMEGISTGVYAVKSTGVRITYNDIKNVKGPFPRGQGVQFDEVNGIENIISFNTFENITGQSNPEDAISLYNSNGVQTEPIEVIGNRIRGGGPSNSGGGIMAGDNGGSYIFIEGNILVNPGQYGISVASGYQITISNNKIFSQKFPFSNVGLVAWNQYAHKSYSNTIENNEVNFTNMHGVLNNLWNAGNMGEVIGWNTNSYNLHLTDSILPLIIIGNAHKRASEIKK